MNVPMTLTFEESSVIADALREGDADQAFTLLAAYLARNKLTLSDDTLKLYLELELFACLEGRGQIFDTI